MKRFAFFLFSLFILSAQYAEAQKRSEATEEALAACFEKDDSSALKKLLATEGLSLEKFIQAGKKSQTLLFEAIDKNAFAVARYIYENSKQDADALLKDGCEIHTVSCYRYENKAAFEFLAILLRDAKKLGNSPKLYRTTICGYDMGENGYEYGKAAILVLMNRGIDIQPFLLDLCKTQGGDDSHYSFLDEYILWLIDQGADPHKKTGESSAYELTSPQLRAAIDKQAEKKKAKLEKLEAQKKQNEEPAVKAEEKKKKKKRRRRKN